MPALYTTATPTQDFPVSSTTVINMLLLLGLVCSNLIGSEYVLVKAPLVEHMRTILTLTWNISFLEILGEHAKALTDLAHKVYNLHNMGVILFPRLTRLWYNPAGDHISMPWPYFSLPALTELTVKLCPHQESSDVTSHFHSSLKFLPQIDRLSVVGQPKLLEAVWRSVALGKEQKGMRISAEMVLRMRAERV